MNYTEAEKVHHDVMRSIAQHLSETTPMVLKGGTALLLGHGLDRHSTDLDYDVTRAMKLDSRVTNAVKKIGKVTDVRLTKEGEATTRNMVDYEVRGIKGTVKIEQSHRNEPNPATVTEIDGIRMYTAKEIAEQKADAMLGERPRTKARDAYDLAHLAREAPEELGEKAKAAIAHAYSGESEFYSRYERAFQNDSVLSPKDFDTSYFTLVEAHEKIVAGQGAEARIDSAIKGGGIGDIATLREEFAKDPSAEHAARARNPEPASQLVLQAAKVSASPTAENFESLATNVAGASMDTEKKVSIVLGSLNRMPLSVMEKVEAKLVLEGKQSPKEFHQRTKSRNEAGVKAVKAVEVKTEQKNSQKGSQSF